MKKYFIRYYRDFGNTYNLYSVASPADESALAQLGDCEKITLKAARQKIHNERETRRYDPNFGGYGAVEIVPASQALCLLREIA